MVGWLNVSVDDFVPVEAKEASEDLERDVTYYGLLESASGQSVLDRALVHERHSDVDAPLLDKGPVGVDHVRACAFIEILDFSDDIAPTRLVVLEGDFFQSYPGSRGSVEGLEHLSIVAFPDIGAAFNI